jgi:hypothetical protein
MRSVRRAHKLATFMRRLSENPVTFKFLEASGPI